MSSPAPSKPRSPTSPPPAPPLPAGFPGGYVRIIGTVGEGGRVTLQRAPATPRP